MSRCFADSNVSGHCSFHSKNLVLSRSSFFRPSETCVASWKLAHEVNNLASTITTGEYETSETVFCFLL